jgi:hypothetical protein
MSRPARVITIVLSVIFLLFAAGVYFFYYFFRSFAPPKITITTTYISTNRSFTNGIGIEKIQVDSMGERYPVKYTVVYSTSCNLKRPTNKPSKGPHKINFNKPGKYSWDEDTTQISYVHEGLAGRSLNERAIAWWLNKYGEHQLCPLKFERQQWYFFTVGDPRVTGLFFYIDETGKEHQYFLSSGVSPI